MALTKPALTEVAYFSMEFMLESDIPTYAGGLGVLAGDLLRSCADMGISAVGVTLVYNGNIFSQHIEPDGSQTFKSVDWRKVDQLTKLTERISLTIHNEEVHVGVWRYDIVGLTGFVVPVYLLDTSFEENSQWAQNISQNLYADQGDLRIAQEIVLGIGGVKMLRKLGYGDIRTYHMNEGHCGFVPLALLEEHGYQDAEVRKLCSFTTHTPIPEGHDTFDYAFAHTYGEKYIPWHIKDIASQEIFHMTKLAMNMSKHTNAVSHKHMKVSQHIFPGFTIGAITNGVHHRTWISPYLQDVYEAHIPGVIMDPSKLKKAPEMIPDDVLWHTHQKAKRELMDYANKHITDLRSHEGSFITPEEFFDENILTIAMARRPVAYKRPLLMYHDIEKLLEIGEGKIQILQCGKSHPHDINSQNIVKEVMNISQKLKGRIRVDYLEDYSPRLSRLLVAGADMWLNTPMQPLEASGTSGMKAAMNGVLNFSVPDGWWIEGYRMEPDAGFVIGAEIPGLEASFDDAADADSIYTQLRDTIIPMYYSNKPEWIRRMKHAIALGGYFNTHRCIREYKKYAWDA